MQFARSVLEVGVSVTRIGCFVAASIAVATAARADDRLAGEISVAQSEAGRMEIAAVPLPVSASDGAAQQVFTIKQDDQRVGWGEWTPVLAAPPAHWPATRIMARHSRFGQLVDFWLENGTLRIARQDAGNPSFTPLAERGANFNSLAVAEDANNRFVVLTVGQDGTLWGLRQFQTSAWDAMKQIGGHDLAGGGTMGSARLEPFVAHANALAAAQGVSGRVNAFAVGGDKVLYVATQPDADHLPTIWSSLGGSDFVDVAAFSSGGRATVVAIDSAQVLHSRRENASGSWGSWRQAFPKPVDSWTAVADNHGQALLFATIGSAVHALTLAADGSWNENPAVHPFDFGGHPILPYRQLSVAVGTDDAIVLAAVDGAGQIFTLPFTDLEPAAGTIKAAAGPVTIGPVTVSPNPPDVAAQVRGCQVAQDAFDALEDGVKQGIAQAPELAGLGQSVASTLVCAKDGTSQSIALWLGQRPSPSAVPTGLIDLSQGANPFESVAIRLTSPGIQRILDVIWAQFPKRQPVGLGFDFVLKSAKLRYGTNDLSVDLTGDLGVGKVPVSLSATLKATLGLSSTGTPTCIAKLSASTQLVEDQLAGFQQTARMVCDLVKAFPTTLLLPPAPGQSPQKMVFKYNRLQIDKTAGITFSAELPPLPVDRQPKVVWSRVTSLAAGNASNQKILEFAASSADMNGPRYSWRLTSPGGLVTPIAGGQIVQHVFHYQGQLTLGQSLGTLKVSVTDDDHGGAEAAVYSAPVVVTSDMLRTPGQGDKTSNQVPTPLSPN